MHAENEQKFVSIKTIDFWIISIFIIEYYLNDYNSIFTKPKNKIIQISL